MTREKAIERIFDELKKAEQKFPGWPSDIVHGASIVAEEAGELVKASLDIFYGRSQSYSEVIKEASQTGAMALRFLLFIADMEKKEEWECQCGDCRRKRGES